MAFLDETGLTELVTKVKSWVTGQGYTKNTGTITGIKMNGSNKGSSGVVDLGTVITEHQDISGKSDIGHKHTKSEITDFPTSMPASDVYSWAKASTKPTYTASEVGLGNVANVSTNNQTPTYTTSTSLTALTSGEKLSVAFGKIAKAVTDLISHLADTVSHITALERTAWNNAKDKSDVTNIAYGTCTTAGNVAEKVVALEGNDNWELKKGAIIMVKFESANTASNVTLNVNGTGGKPIWYGTSVYKGSSSTVCGTSNRYHTYMYNGTHWVWLSYGQDANTTYTNQSLGQGYATCTTAASTTAKVATLSGYSKTLYGIVAVKFTYAVPANATLNINNRGASAIYYRGSAITAGVIKAGNTATFMYDGSYYQLLTIDKLTASDVGALSTGGGIVYGTLEGENGNGDTTWWINELGEAGDFRYISAETFKENGTNLSNKYAAKSHTHTEYASTSHNHDSKYAPKSHTHTTSDITDISSLQNKTWNYIGSATGTNAITIPSGYSEVYFEVSVNNQIYNTINGSYITAISGSRNIRITGVNLKVIVEINALYVKMNNVLEDEIDKISTSTIVIYAR